MEEQHGPGNIPSNGHPSYPAEAWVFFDIRPEISPVHPLRNNEEASVGAKNPHEVDHIGVPEIPQL